MTGGSWEHINGVAYLYGATVFTHTDGSVLVASWDEKTRYGNIEAGYFGYVDVFGTWYGNEFDNEPEVKA